MRRGGGGRLFEAGRLLTFSTLRMGAYSRWALIRGWAVIRINTVGELKRAKECHESALAIYLKRHGPDHANVASCHHHLGCIHHDLGDIELAKEYHERALAIHLKALGPDHAEVAKCYHYLGRTHHDLGDLELAKEYHELAQRLGPDNVDIASSYHHLGCTHYDLPYLFD